MVDPAQNEFLAGLEAKSKQPSPFFRAMANRSEVLKNFVPFYGAIMGPGSVERRFRVPEGVDKDKIEAAFANGVLKVIMPKVKAAAPKSIEIKNNN